MVFERRELVLIFFCTVFHVQNVTCKENNNSNVFCCFDEDLQQHFVKVIPPDGKTFPDVGNLRPPNEKPKCYFVCVASFNRHRYFIGENNAKCLKTKSFELTSDFSRKLIDLKGGRDKKNYLCSISRRECFFGDETVGKMPDALNKRNERSVHFKHSIPKSLTKQLSNNYLTSDKDGVENVDNMTISDSESSVNRSLDNGNLLDDLMSPYTADVEDFINETTANNTALENKQIYLVNSEYNRTNEPLTNFQLEDKQPLTYEQLLKQQIRETLISDNINSEQKYFDKSNKHQPWNRLRNSTGRNANLRWLMMKDFTNATFQRNYKELLQRRMKLRRIFRNHSNVGIRQPAATGISIPDLTTSEIVRIPFYLIIFFTGIIGNSLVIITLVRIKKMRTVTNVFLLNLAVADLLMGVFCMPVTLVGSLLKHFVFGAVMCHLITYCQAVCVAVSVWTLVAVSLERYYAICQPLKSRGWQTRCHAYRIITMVWIMAFVSMSPIAILSELSPAGREGHMKCREKWPSLASERVFSIGLGVVLLLVPLVVMSVAYTAISLTLCHGIRLEKRSGKGSHSNYVHSAAEAQRSIHGQRREKGRSKISIRFRKFPDRTNICHFCKNLSGPESHHSNGEHSGFYRPTNQERPLGNQPIKQEQNYVHLKDCTPPSNKSSLKDNEKECFEMKEIKKDINETPDNQIKTSTKKIDAEDRNFHEIAPSRSECNIYATYTSLVTEGKQFCSCEDIKKRTSFSNPNSAVIGFGQTSRKLPQKLSVSSYKSDANICVPGRNVPHYTCDRTGHHDSIRSSHLAKSIMAKKKVIRMLFALVLEFFICWSPIFVINILVLYIPKKVYVNLGLSVISFFHLLSYTSCCCNPITYCFMNKRFYQAFLHVFGCKKQQPERQVRVPGSNLSYRNGSRAVNRKCNEDVRDNDKS